MAKSNRETFGQKLQRLRGERSARSLSKAAGLSHTMIGLLERDERDPTLTTLLQLARALEVPPEKFLENLETKVDKS